MYILYLLKSKSITVCIPPRNTWFPSFVSFSLLDLTPPCRIFSLEKATRMLLMGTQQAETSWRTVMIIVLLSPMTLHCLCLVQVRLSRQADHHSRSEWHLGPSFNYIVQEDNEILINHIDLLIESYWINNIDWNQTLYLRGREKMINNGLDRTNKNPILTHLVINV